MSVVFEDGSCRFNSDNHRRCLCLYKITTTFEKTGTKLKQSQSAKGTNLCSKKDKIHIISQCMLNTTNIDKDCR